MKFKVSVDIECGDSWDFEVDREKLKTEVEVKYEELAM